MKTYKVDVDDDGNKYWLLNNKLHREDGPAIEYADGSKQWILNGKRHRTDGPAVEYADGTKMWYLNGECHREDGPAIEYADGTKQWYLNGEQFTETDFTFETEWCKQTQKTKAPCVGKVVEVDGVKYKLVEA
jgi:hypothetical protein